jgi:phenylpropionate dioxygenase-like ring-hydroxylating dioxygenase large terminal subunit
MRAKADMAVALDRHPVVPTDQSQGLKRCRAEEQQDQSRRPASAAGQYGTTSRNGVLWVNTGNDGYSNPDLVQA